MLGIDVDEAERAVGIAGDGGEDLIVLLAEVVGRRVVGPLHAHVDAEPADAHAVGDFQEAAEARFGRGVLERAGEMAVDVPDFGHGAVIERLGGCHRGTTEKRLVIAKLVICYWSFQK